MLVVQCDTADSSDSATYIRVDMTSSGYTPLPSDPPPAYAAGAANSAFAGGYADDRNKDAPQPAAPSAMPPYPGGCMCS